MIKGKIKRVKIALKNRVKRPAIASLWAINSKLFRGGRGASDPPLPTDGASPLAFKIKISLFREVDGPGKKCLHYSLQEQKD